MKKNKIHSWDMELRKKIDALIDKYERRWLYQLGEEIKEIAGLKDKRWSSEEVKQYDVFITLMEASYMRGLEHDLLGEIMEYENSLNDSLGQVFTPMGVAQLVIEMNFVHFDSEVERKGFVEVLEPACGSGRMMVGFYSWCLSTGRNFRSSIWWNVDRDYRMYIATAYNGIIRGMNAIAVCGDTLAGEYSECIVNMGFPYPHFEHISSGEKRFERIVRKLRGYDLVKKRPFLDL